MKSVIEHPRIGEVTLCRSRRARRISLTVRPTGEVRLSMPLTVPLSAGMAFLEEKAEWVEKTKIKQAEKHPREIISMPYYTRRHSLRLDPADTDKASVRVKAGEILVRYPMDMNFACEEIQRSIKKGIEEAWRAEAKEYLPARVEELSRRFGLKVRSVSVRNTVSKWGSCSPRDELSLSLHLMRMPDELIDYVITHELCHVKHKNHGPKFHRLLDELTGGQHENMRREMRKWSPRW